MCFHKVDWVANLTLKFIEVWVKFQYGLVSWNLNPPGFFLFYKLGEIYGQLWNTNKILKKMVILNHDYMLLFPPEKVKKNLHSFLMGIVAPSA